MLNDLCLFCMPQSQIERIVQILCEWERVICVLRLLQKMSSTGPRRHGQFEGFFFFLINKKTKSMTNNNETMQGETENSRWAYLKPPPSNTNNMNVLIL